MEPVQPHFKPILAKYHTSKLPDAFMPTRSQEAQASKNAQEPEQSAPKKRQKDKSKNPFLPIRDYLKLAEKIDSQIQEAQMEISMGRINKLVAESRNQKALKERGKLRFENCVTISLVRKFDDGCLRKILHVPTLTLHFLRESLIHAGIDKQDLLEWMETKNKEVGVHGLQTQELFWNMPEGFYSLVYEYVDGIGLDSFLFQCNTLPLSLLQATVRAYLASNMSIFNAYVLLNQDIKTGRATVKYLPIYEETAAQLLPLGNQMEQLFVKQTASFSSSFERKLVWRLASLTLVGLIGDIILSEDLKSLPSQLTSCCLFHQICANESSLTNLFLKESRLQNFNVIEFLCKAGRIPKQHDVSQAPSLRNFNGHKFVRTEAAEVVTLGELLAALQPDDSVDSKFQKGRFKKLCNAVGLILQNVSDMPKVDWSTQNQHLKALCKDFGFAGRQVELIAQLKAVYTQGA